MSPRTRRQIQARRPVEASHQSGPGFRHSVASGNAGRPAHSRRSQFCQAIEWSIALKRLAFGRHGMQGSPACAMVMATLALFLGCRPDADHTLGDVTLASSNRWVSPPKGVQEVLATWYGVDPERAAIGERIDVKQVESWMDQRSRWGQAFTSDGTLKAISIRVFIDQCLEHGNRLGILCRSDGRVAVLIGVVRLADESFLQILDQSGKPSLISALELDGMGETHVWTSTRPNPAWNGIVIGMDAGKIEIDRVIHNFGEVKPMEIVTTRFRIRNVGDSSLKVGDITTSCGCVTGEIDGNDLEPGDARWIDVSVAAMRSRSISQHVVFSICTSGKHEKRWVELSLYGNQQASLECKPESIDFGVVVASDRPKHRSMRISEVENDRFSILSVRSPAPQVSHVVTTRTRQDGLRDYLIRLTLDPHESPRGKQSTEVIVETTSRLTPRVVIPVGWEMPEDIVLSPRSIIFGTILPSDSLYRCVEIHSRDDRPIEIDVISRPSGFRCCVEPQREDRTRWLLKVDGTVSRPGVLSEVISLNVHYEGKVQRCEVTCVGHVLKS